MEPIILLFKKGSKMSYSANSKKAFFSLVRAGGVNAWADSMKTFSEFFINNSSENHQFDESYYLKPVDSRKIGSMLECHVSMLSPTSPSSGRWKTLRMNTTSTEKAKMAQVRNFYAWMSVYSDDSMYMSSLDGFEIDAYDSQYHVQQLVLNEDRTSSVLFFYR